MTDKESWPDVTASLAKDANGGKEKEGDKAKEQRTKKGTLAIHPLKVFRLINLAVL
jgi:hypothetical protein